MKCGAIYKQDSKGSTKISTKLVENLLEHIKAWHWGNIWSITSSSARSHWKNLIGTHCIKQEKRKHSTN
eukprot:14710397-Ditylum_brightwellii.AAC.1